MGQQNVAKWHARITFNEYPGIVQGVNLWVVKADSGVAAEVQAVLLWAHENMPAIEHHAHAAGVSGFDMLQDMSHEEFWAVCQPKVVGADAFNLAALPLNTQVQCLWLLDDSK